MPITVINIHTTYTQQNSDQYAHNIGQGLLCVTITVINIHTTYTLHNNDQYTHKICITVITTLTHNSVQYTRNIGTTYTAIIAMIVTIIEVHQCTNNARSSWGTTEITQNLGGWSPHHPLGKNPEPLWGTSGKAQMITSSPTTKTHRHTNRMNHHHFKAAPCC